MEPYNSSAYGYETSSWNLRRNLTETFNQVGAVEKSKQKQQQKEAALQPSSFVGNKIAQFEKKNSKRENDTSTVAMKPAALGGKPPKQPSHQTRGTTTMTDTKTSSSSSSGEKRSVSVFLRVRPPKDSVRNTIEILPGDPPTKVRTHAPSTSNVAKMNRDSSSRGPPCPSDTQDVIREFDFQEVFGPDKENKDVYSTVVAPTVDRMFPSDPSKQPESAVLFAIGATNAGKTYSILGKIPSGHGAPVDEKHGGIVPRAIQDVLEHMEQLQVKEPDVCHDLYMSVMEIHNENIYDLLVEDRGDSRHPMYMREPLKLRESHKHTFIRGLVKQPINDVSEGLQFAKRANSKRHTASNNLNSDSSRSHCIFQLQIMKRSANIQKLREGSSTGTAAANGYSTDEEASRLSKQKPTTLWIVDLAGSERSKRTNVGSLRQKEASLINKSLMNLMRCLSIIRENQSANSTNQVIPYRESKLTHIFMPVLTGRSPSSISMIVNVNPSAPDFDETNHVLSYASDAKLVQIEDLKMPAESSNQVGAGEYGYDGRPVKRGSSAVSKMTKLIKKLSPKKLMKRGNSKDDSKSFAANQADRKRKGAPTGPARALSFNNPNKDNAKKMRVATKPSEAHPRPQQDASSSSATIATGDNTKSLKMALSIAHGEIEDLKSENSKLTEEIAQVEARIRLEVSAEMDEQLEHTKQYYTGIIERMKSESRQSVGVFEKKTREAKAAEQIDLLIFKVEECEEEMQRQADNHREELLALQEHYDQTSSAQQQEVEQLKERLREKEEDNGEDQEGGGKEGAIVETQRRTIAEQEQEIAALKKSKTDLIEAYEKLLADDEEEEEDSSTADEEGSAASGNENTVVQPKPKYMTRTHSKAKKGTKSPGARAPLSSISGN